MLLLPLLILQFPEQGASLLLCQPSSSQEEFILRPHDSHLPPPHMLLQWEGRQCSPCTFPDVYSEYTVWRDSKLQMLFYIKSFFFLLVLWIFFHPWGITEQSTLAQSQMIYFPWQNQNVLLRVYSGLWNRLGFFPWGLLPSFPLLVLWVFCGDFNDSSTHAHSEYTRSGKANSVPLSYWDSLWSQQTSSTYHANTNTSPKPPLT